MAKRKSVSERMEDLGAWHTPSQSEKDTANANKELEVEDSTAAKQESEKKNTDVIKEEEKDKVEETKKEKAKTPFNRQTYYLTPDLIDALALYAAFEKIDKSEIVREALKRHIPDKYKEMAKHITKEEKKRGLKISFTRGEMDGV